MAVPVVVGQAHSCAQEVATYQRWFCIQLLLLGLLLLPSEINCDTSCYTCDNYFELNVRNKDPNLQVDMRRRYCGVDSLPSEERQSDCIGKDYNGCVKIVTKSFRHHIDRAGYGLRSDETLIATVVTRDCADVPPAMGYGCHTVISGSSSREICFCQGEYCNSATSSVRPEKWRAAAGGLFLALICGTFFKLCNAL